MNLVKDQVDKWYSLLRPAVEGTMDADELLLDIWTPYQKSIILNIVVNEHHEREREEYEKEKRKNKRSY